MGKSPSARGNPGEDEEREAAPWERLSDDGEDSCAWGWRVGHDAICDVICCCVGEPLGRETGKRSRWQMKPKISNSL